MTNQSLHRFMFFSAKGQEIVFPDISHPPATVLALSGQFPLHLELLSPSSRKNLVIRKTPQHVVQLSRSLRL